jgi:hypothetical protein
LPPPYPPPAICKHVDQQTAIPTPNLCEWDANVAYGKRNMRTWCSCRAPQTLRCCGGFATRLAGAEHDRRGREPPQRHALRPLLKQPVGAASSPRRCCQSTRPRRSLAREQDHHSPVLHFPSRPDRQRTGKPLSPEPLGSGDHQDRGRHAFRAARLHLGYRPSERVVQDVRRPSCSAATPTNADLKSLGERELQSRPSWSTMWRAAKANR